MAKQDYLPDDTDDLDTWYQTWLTNIDAVLTAIGIPILNAAALKAKIIALRNQFTAWKNKKQEAQSFSDTFKSMRTDTEKDLRKFDTQIKAQPAYTTSLGETVGIEGAEETIDPLTAKPVLKAVLSGGEPVIKFPTHPLAKGVNITSKRGSETDYSFLASDTNTPYDDHRANLDATKPETRKYVAFFFDSKGKEFGLQSDEVSITVP